MGENHFFHVGLRRDFVNEKNCVDTILEAVTILLMGLNTSHDCWHGPYSYFKQWRKAVCECAGLGDLNERKGFSGDKEWSENDIIIKLLNHSDCDGEIALADCLPLADRLEQLSQSLANAGWEQETKQFIAGLRLAVAQKESVDFH